MSCVPLFAYVLCGPQCCVAVCDRDRIETTTLLLCFSVCVSVWRGSLLPIYLSLFIDKAKTKT
jgi:hypothetical protein